MTNYYVGSGGNNANAGTSWALRKETLNGAEDIPVAAGDTVYVGPGVYAAMTVDVSGSGGSPVTYIGDYTGQNTDGAGGMVSIAVNSVSAKHYRTFSGFLFDNGNVLAVAASTNWIVEKCAFNTNGGGGDGISFTGAGQAAHTVRRCWFLTGGNTGLGVYFGHTVSVPDTGHVVENCLFLTQGQNGTAVRDDYIGGITTRNCTFFGNNGVDVRNLAAGQTVNLNNSILYGLWNAIYAGATGMVTEDYNALVGCATARTNTSTGANSITTAARFDTRWFFEMVNGGSMVTPFDLSSLSGLIELNSGTGAPGADLRGTATIGTYKEWGALEYDNTLDVEAGAGGGGGPIIGSRIIRGLGAI